MWASKLKSKIAIDVLMPGSANDHFFSTIAFARISLDALGGVFAEARLVAVLGEWEKAEIPVRWQKHFENIDVIWANAEKRPNPTFAAQHFDRFSNIREDADLAIICDADICFMGRFSDLISEVLRDDFIGGVMAHYHFPIDGKRGDPELDWSRISNAVLGRSVALEHRYLFGRAPDLYPLFDKFQRPRAPFYINYGFLIGKPEPLKALAAREKELTPVVETLVEPYFAAQVALALACDDLGLKTRSLPARYNYPNRPETRLLHPGELSQIVVMHYMYEENFRRSRVFANKVDFEAFMTKRVRGSDAVFQKKIKDITSGVYPFG